jgi:hypothetical protein
MGVPAFCSVTVQITAINDIVLAEPITVFADVLFPEVNGSVNITVLGVPLTIPCPSDDLEETITVNGTEFTLLINAEPVVNG